MNYLGSILNLIYDSINPISISITMVLFSICTIIIVLNLEKKFRNMNKNLSYKEELFQSLYSSVSDVFIIYDNINKRFDYISPNFENSLGFSSSELTKNVYALFNYISEEQKNELMSHFTSSKPTEFKEHVFEYYHPVKKQNLWLVFRIYPIYNNEEITRYIASIVEVTKEYQAQAKIIEALSNARKANESKTEFISHMSHELKTPINAILGMTQIAMNSLSDPEKVKNCLDKIDFSSRNLIALINNILDSSKHNSNKLFLNYEPFSLLNTIADFSSTMSSQAELKKIEYKLIYHKMVHDYLMGDRLRILQILGNCLSNSIKFTPAGGLVTLEISEVQCSEKDSLYRFVISDTGKGMKEEYISHIFEPFHQEDDSISYRYGGSGLGMSIVKTLLDLMNGTIQIESKIGIGTKITIDIRLNIAQKIDHAVESKQNLKDLPEFNLQGMRVLVVEDNEINLEVTTEYLKFINIQVESVTNGYDAIKLFNESKEGYYSAILMDLQMPDLSGYETSRRIRTSGHPDADKVYILAMTADSLVDHYSCIQNGMNYHIMKPIDIDNFYSILKTIKEKG